MTVRLSGPERRQGLPVVDRRLLRARGARLLAALARRRAELSIHLAADAEIAQLNAGFRGRPSPTDVLAFSLLEGEGSEHSGSLLGDVVIGVETAARQARARRRALDDEVARLLIHGTLHLLGFDHERAEDARRMRAEERRLWGVVAPRG
jgi:rRNA maturation RNase YbeY